MITHSVAIRRRIVAMIQLGSNEADYLKFDRRSVDKRKRSIFRKVECE